VDEAKRQGILDAAVQAFSTFGFKKTSIGDIAKAAGVGKGTVYLACKSKEDLFFQVVMQDLRKWIASVSAIIDPRKPADELLLNMTKKSFAFFEKFPLVQNLFIGIYHGDHPSWAGKFESLRALGRANIAAVLRLGIRQGRFRSDLDVDRTARILQEFQHAALVLNTQLSSEHMNQRLDDGFDLIFRGLCASKQ
jgi:AcrR family transcriptional regulator